MFTTFAALMLPEERLSALNDVRAEPTRQPVVARRATATTEPPVERRAGLHAASVVIHHLLERCDAAASLIAAGLRPHDGQAGRWGTSRRNVR